MMNTYRIIHFIIYIVLFPRCCCPPPTALATAHSHIVPSLDPQRQLHVREDVDQVLRPAGGQLVAALRMDEVVCTPFTGAGALVQTVTPFPVVPVRCALIRLSPP